MNYSPFLTLLLPVVPALTAAICLFFVATKYNYTSTDTRLRSVLIAFYTCSVFVWISPILYTHATVAFTYVNSFVYLGMLAINVIFYHIIFILTSARADERFPRAHYIVMAILPAALFMWSFFVPFDAQLKLAQQQDLDYVVSGHGFYSMLFLSKLKINLVYFSIYTVLGILRMYSFGQRMSDPEERQQYRSLNWLKHLLMLAPLVVIISVVISVSESDLIFESKALFPLLIALVVYQHIAICHHYMAGHYTLATCCDNDIRRDISATAGGISPGTVKQEDIPGKLDRESFEHYVNTYRPHLSPHLMIHMVAAQLHSNRAYISSFINQTYGCNFNRYFNRCRLVEFERLRRENPDSNIHDLVSQAGFTNYRHMSRARQTEREKGEPRKAAAKNGPTQ